MNTSLQGIISYLNLTPLEPEGGYYKRTYPAAAKTDESRQLMSAIYYLVTPESFSGLHVLDADEIYHFYSGDVLEIHTVDMMGNYTVTRLGNNFTKGEVPQLVVTAGTFQCSKICSVKLGYSLVGTTVSPAFNFKDFRMVTKVELAGLSGSVQEVLLPFIKMKSAC